MLTRSQLCCNITTEVSIYKKSDDLCQCKAVTCTVRTDMKFPIQVLLTTCFVQTSNGIILGSYKMHFSANGILLPLNELLPPGQLSMPVLSQFQSPLTLTASLQFYKILSVHQVRHRLTSTPNIHIERKLTDCNKLSMKIIYIDELAPQGGVQ